MGGHRVMLNIAIPCITVVENAPMIKMMHEMEKMVRENADIL